VSYPVTWIITAGVLIVYYVKSDWLGRAMGHTKSAS